MDTIGDTAEYDEDCVPDQSYPDQPDSFLAQYFTENDYLPVNFPYEGSLESRDHSGDAATPGDNFHPAVISLTTSRSFNIAHHITEHETDDTFTVQNNVIIIIIITGFLSGLVGFFSVVGYLI